jgi:signal transduction histidine kinase
VLTKKDKRTPLLQYWTTRYLITLCIGLIIIGIISSVWIRYNTVQKRSNSLKALAQEIAETVVDSNGNFYFEKRLPGDIERRQRFLGLERELIMFIANNEGEIIYSKPGLPPMELIRKITIPINQEQGVQELTTEHGEKFYIVKQVIKNGKNVIGNIFIISTFREIARNPEDIKLLILMLGGLAILGWLIIYSLTRNLAKPIKNVADAAKQIVTGNYDLQLNKDAVKEKEIYELIESFKDMADRLRQLEALRTELLAGVTHELKTPVTSISGLIQAIRDEVVTGDEAKEFLEICSKETTRLQKMVEDLLDFNYFVTGDIKVEKKQLDLNRLVEEISYQWLIGQDENTISIETKRPDKELVCDTDAMRLRQILYNLFNNAKQVFVNNGKIGVSLYETDIDIRIDVADNGPGIPPEEQELIFERFFRGKGKKDRVHGLGLGLSFSKMIARALGGDLILKNSSAIGSTFTIILTKQLHK